MNKEGILVFDLEIGPSTGYFWPGRMYEQDIIKVTEDWHILTFSAKWVGGEQVTRGLPDYRGFKKDRHSDKELVTELWHLLNKAEVVIGHNSNAFDMKKINTRFLHHKLPPPQPYLTIDTKLVAKRYFSFDSNKLDLIGEFTKEGRKVDHEGFPLWQRCLEGNKQAFKDMCRYNKQDVLLDEKIYLRFRPWIKNHPVLNLEDSKGHCTKCGSHKLEKRGLRRGFQRYQCQDCFGWVQGIYNENRDEDGHIKKQFKSI